jgi:hypothetical protein
MYDQIGGTAQMVPEGSANPLIVVSGELVLQGLRLGFGNDANNQFLKDTSYTVLGAGALFAVGRVGAAGNPIMAAGSANTLSIHRVSGASGYASGGASFTLNTSLEWEPAWVVAEGAAAKGYNLHACLVMTGAHYVNGDLTPATSATAFTYASAGLAWGGRIGQTNRNHVGTQVALMAFDAAPTGADLTEMLAISERWISPFDGAAALTTLNDATEMTDETEFADA